MVDRRNTDQTARTPRLAGADVETPSGAVDSPALDVVGCRAQRPYSYREYVGRVAWAVVFPLFRLSPRPFFAWRRFLLRCFGARVGKSVHVYSSTRVYLPWKLTLGDYSSLGEWVLVYNLGHVTVGERATVSHRAHLCAGTHDHRDPLLPLQRSPIQIQAQAWVCADAFVGPGVTVGEGAVVAAAAVVVRDVGAWTIVAGNPSKPVGRRILSEGHHGN